MKPSLLIFAISIFIHSQSSAHNFPLKDKKFGVEVNIPRLFTLVGNHNWQSASGSFSYFNDKSNTEIAVPWLIEKLEPNAKEYDRTLSDQTIAVHYRKFLGKSLNGVYWSGFVKLAHVKGRERDYGHPRPKHALNKSPCYGDGCENTIKDGTSSYSNPQKSSYKFGIGMGTGYRFFPKNKPYYWGASLSVGQYLTGKHNLYDGGTGLLTADSKYIVDIELLKFGYAF
ncbi:MAG: hypothetical protein V3V19_06085 [Cocleimonas sp.]